MSDIEVGQHWRRKRDGTVIEITGFNTEWDDCTWREVDGHRKGDIFAANLRVNYERVDVPDEPVVEVSTPYQVLLAALVAEYGADEETWTATRSLHRVLAQVHHAIEHERADRQFEAGVRQAMSWLRADYVDGDMPGWRETGADWIAGCLAEWKKEHPDG